MRRSLVALLLGSIILLVWPTSLSGQIRFFRGPNICTVAQIKATTCPGTEVPVNGGLFIVTDGLTSSECGNAGDTGEGTNENFCRYSADSGTYILVSAGGVGGGATSEAELESDLTDVSDVYTDNDGDPIYETELNSEAKLETQLTDVSDVLTNTDPLSDHAYTPDSANQWIATPGNVDAALEDLLDHAGSVFNVRTFGVTDDAVDASSCSGTNPKVCTTPGTGTNNTTSFASIVNAAAAVGGGRLHFPFTNTGKYRGAFVVDEDNVVVTCDPGVKLMPVFNDTNGGVIMTVAQAGAYTEGFKLIGCEFYDDDYEDHGHNGYDSAGVDNPTGVTGSVSSMADYNAVTCTGTCGAGDDINVSGTFRAGAAVKFEIEIVSEGTPDTFKWRRNEGRYQDDQNVSTSAIELSNGISIYWDDTDNHTAGDVWTTTKTPTPQTKVTTAASHNMSDLETVELYSMTQSNYNGLSLIGYIDADEFTIRRPYTATATGSFRQAPGIAENAEFGAGWTGDAQVVRYNETLDQIRINVTSGTLGSGDDIRLSGGGGWIVEDATSVEANPNIAMSALQLDRTRNALIAENIFRDIGGYSIEIGTSDDDYPAIGTFVYKNKFLNCPSHASKDACVDIRTSDNAVFESNEFDGGVSGGYTAQGIMGLATSASATAGARYTTFLSNILYDNDPPRPQGAIDQTDWGFFWQPNASGIAIDTTIILGGFIHHEHYYEIASVPRFALKIGTAAGPVTNVKIDQIDIKGPVDLQGHLDNTVTFSNFSIDCMYGWGLYLKGKRLKISDGVIQGCSLGGISVLSGSIDATVSDVDVLDTGVGVTSGSTTGQVYLGTGLGLFKMIGGSIEGAPSITRDLNGIGCNSNEKASIIGVDIANVEARCARNCREVIGGYMTKCNGIQTQAADDDAIIMGIKMIGMSTKAGAANVCVSFGGDTGIVSDIRCASDHATAVSESGNWNLVHGNISTNADGTFGGGAFTCAGTGSQCYDNLVTTP